MISTFTSPTEHSLFWYVTAGERRYQIKWDGASFLLTLRRILWDYLWTPRVVASQTAFGGTIPYDPLPMIREIAFNYLTKPLSIVPGAANLLEVDTASDWRYEAVNPALLEGASAVVDTPTLRAVYAYMNRVRTRRNASDSRILLNAPSDWQRLLETAATQGQLDFQTMQILVAIITEWMMQQVTGSYSLEIPADTQLPAFGVPVLAPANAPTSARVVWLNDPARAIVAQEEWIRWQQTWQQQLLAQQQTAAPTDDGAGVSTLAYGAGLIALAGGTYWLVRRAARA